MARSSLRSVVLVLVMAVTGWAQEGQPRAPASEAPDGAEHVIFVPFRDLRTIGIEKDGQVILKAADYEALLRRLRLAERVLRALPTRQAVLHRATYSGRVESNRLLLQAELELEALAEGWSRLPWQLQSGSISRVETEGRRALVWAAESGRYELLVEGPGRTRVTMELVFPVKAEPGVRHFTLELPAAGVARLDVRLPGTELTVKLSPELVFETTEQEDTTLVRIDLGGQRTLTVSWYPKAEAAESGRLLTATVESLVSVASTSLETATTVHFDVLRGAVAELRLLLQPNERVLEVSAPEVRQWQVIEADGRRLLQVQLYRPVSDDFVLDLRTDRPVQGNRTELTIPMPLDVARVSGAVGVRAEEELVIAPGALERAVQVDAADVTPALRRAELFFRFYSPQMRIPVSLTPVRPWIHVDSVTSLWLRRTDVFVTLRASFDVQRIGVFALAFRLPKAFVIEQLQCDGMDRYDVRDLGEARELRVTFAKRRSGRIEMSLRGTMPLMLLAEDQPTDVAFQIPEILGVNREQSTIQFVVPEGLSAVYVPERSEGVVPINASELADPAALPRPGRRQRLAALFTVSKHPVRITLRMRRRPARVVATVATLIGIHPTSATVQARLRYQIEYSGITRLSFRVPESVAARLHLETQASPAIREYRTQPDPEREQWVRYLVELQNEAIGRYELQLEYELPLQQDEGGRQLRWVAPEVLAVEREEGEVGVTKDEQLSVEAIARGAEAIDPRELTHLPSSGDIRLAFRYTSHPVELTITAAKPPVQPVAETIVRRSLTECLIPSEGRVTGRTLFVVQTSERQRLQVLLHQDARILAVSVAGRTVLPEVAEAEPDQQGRIAYFIDVSRVSDPGEPFPLVLTYEVPGDVRLGRWGKVAIEFPVLAGDVAIDEQLLLCWLPRRWQATTAEGMENISCWWLAAGIVPFQPASLPPDVAALSKYTDGWLTAGSAMQQYALFRSFDYRQHTVIRYASWPLALGTVSSVVLLLAVALVWVRIEWRAVVVVSGALALLVLGLARTEYAFLLTQAGTPGAALGVGLWLMVGTIRLGRRARQARARRATEPGEQSVEAVSSEQRPEQTTQDASGSDEPSESS